ncbi:MAG: hypothetical protein LHW45_11245 [Candidatus Cloacimonetes bacterium]|jgi:hypothetical protein|nr:hypothetical protein [Candidatus Cloacimonadota bacterium]MDY0368183.1 hypothetical protein [Candidatus Syntrophosphaera sp.]
MNILMISVGLALFLSSAMIADLLAMGGWSIVWAGTDYAPAWTSKIIDTLAGSLIIWGVIDIKKKKKSSRLAR